MGTRSLTVFQEDDGQEIVVMYRQMDGYPSGHGAELAEFLASKQMTNGIPLGKDTSSLANGMADLAAQVICHFKQESPIGGFYLHPAGSRNMWEEYIYTVYHKPNVGIKLCVEDSDHRILYDGLASRFTPEQCEEVA